MRAILTLLVFFAMGCGAAQTPELRPMVAEDRRPEARELAQTVRDEPLPEGVPVRPGEGYVVPVTAGECVGEDGSPLVTESYPAESGFMISEARANRDALYRLRYREMRLTYEADRQVWSAHRELYEAQIVADREEISNLQPTWWERHDGTVLTAVGVVVGAAITVAITFAVNQASE